MAVVTMVDCYSLVPMVSSIWRLSPWIWNLKLLLETGSEGPHLFWFCGARYWFQIHFIRVAQHQHVDLVQVIAVQGCGQIE